MTCFLCLLLLTSTGGPPPPGSAAPLAPPLAALSGEQAEGFASGVPVVLGLESNAALEAATERLLALGVEVSWVEPTASVPQLGALVPAARLDAVRAWLRSLAGLAWADLQPAVRLRNAASVGRCQSGLPGWTPLFDRGLHGEGQVVGFMDTGVDADSCFFRDDEHGLPPANDDHGTVVDLDQRKVLAVDFYWALDWPDPGAGDWDSAGHGTHVAGSAAGDAGVPNRHDGNDGMAPAARLVIQDGGFAVDDCSDLPGLGCPLRPFEPVLEQAYQQGARIHSDSWGDEENFTPYNRYTERTADVDRFCWNHKDFLVFFAAGNAGPDLDTVGSPATGKNVVAVGATVHGDEEPPCVAPFSSRGLAHDGRLKPDLVVPGRAVVSAGSDRDLATGNCTELAMSGTSMATPTAAGLAALARQYFVDGYYPTGEPDPESGLIPSAALVKATLVAAAIDLRELGCTAVEPVPSRDQGWGLVVLDRALAFPGDDHDLVVVDSHQGFSTADDPPHRLELTVQVAGPVKVVLVWTDPPSSSLAAVNLVNDLDLAVRGPDGPFLGNVFSGGQSTAGGEADRLNNVEVVWLPRASEGRWTVEVSPHVVRAGPQDYALVVTGPVRAPSPRRPHGRLGG